MIQLSKYAKVLLEAKMTIQLANKIFADLGYKNASNMPKDELRTAWATLSTKYHPDKQGGNVEIMQDINSAYDVLKKAPASPIYSSIVPPWETDKRSAFSMENPPVGDIQYYKKLAWELSGKPTPTDDHKYTFSNWDGYYFRQSFTVYTTDNPEHWFEISKLLIEWDKFYRSVAVFVNHTTYNSNTLYLINHKGKKIIPPETYIHDSFNANPSNDREFTDMLRKKL